MAATPLRFIHVNALLGDREDSESLTLAKVYASDGSRNVYLDKMGRATSVRGYVQRNAGVTANGTGADVRLRALYHYGVRTVTITPAANTTASALTRIVLGLFEGAGSEYELWRSVDGGVTWTFLVDLGATYHGMIPDFAQLGNALVIVFGLGPAKSYDGTTLSNASSVQLAAPVTALSTSVGLLDGNYQWRVVPVQASGVRKMASVASVTLAVSKKQATVDWTADADAASYELYRTAGTGKVFFYEALIPAGTTTYVSNTADLVLIFGRALQEYGDAPASDVRFVEAHSERMWYLGTPTYPRRAYYSDPGLPYSVFADSNFIDCTDEESFSDECVGGTGNYKGMIVIWLERSIWTISGQGRFSGVVIDYVRRRTDAQIGAVSHRAVVKVPKGSVFSDASGNLTTTGEAMLAYLTPLGDVRLFDGTNDTIISWAKQDLFKRLSYAGRKRAFAYLDVEHAEAVWIFPIDGATDNTIGIAWNYKTGQMGERSYPFTCVIPIDADDDAVRLLTGDRNDDGFRTIGETITQKVPPSGYAYTLWQGNTNDGEYVNAQAATKTFYGTDRYGVELLQYEKRWRWVDLLVRTYDSPVALLVEWWPTEVSLDSPASGSSLITLSHALTDSGGNAILTSDGDPLVVGTPINVVRVQLKSAAGTSNTSARFFHARGIRLRVSGSGNSGQWSVVGMELAYQVLAGLRRTFRQ